MNRYLNYKPISKSDDDDLHAARLEPEPSLENAVELNGGWPSFQPRGDWATKWFRPGSLIIASTLLGIFIGVSCYFLGKHVQQLETDTGLSRLRDPYRLPSAMTKNSLGRRPITLNIYGCIYFRSSIWRAYWAAVQGTEPDHDAFTGHVRHCIDYLRQSLMCLADMAQEPMDKNLKSSTGFGVPRTCRNYDKLTAFADEWRVFNE